MSDHGDAIRELYRARPRRPFLRAAIALFALLVAASWLGGDIRIGDLFGERRVRNVTRFLTVDIVPPSMRETGLDAPALADWAGNLLRDPGLSAMGATLAISVLAIVIAGFLGAILALPAARNFMTKDPFVGGSTRPRNLLAWVLLRGTRLLLLFIRSVPEFIWAYLFLAMFGPTAWPAVLALVLHNAGTLGKLDSEVIENLDARAPGALRALGAGRMRIAFFGLFPLVLPRFLLFFFYRFEACVREATVLGMIGIVSLGYHISNARDLRAYDEMIFLILLGAVIVFVADLVSAITRRVVRRAV